MLKSLFDPRFPGLALGLVLTACGGERPADSSWQAAYDTIGDTIVVRTVGGRLWDGPAELVADFTIGEVEGADEYMFGGIRSLAVAPNGSIYVFDSQAKELRKYAADGTYQRTLGREGGGPGEYQQPDGGLAVLPDGRVLLRDPGNARISVFDADGEYLESWRIRGGFNTSTRLFVDSAGNAYVHLLLDYDAPVTEWQLGLARYSSEGVPGDTILPPSWDYEAPSILATNTDGDDTNTSLNDVPFSPQPSWTFSPMGYMIGGLPTRYALDLFIAPDSVLRIERGDWQPVPVLAAEKREQELIATASMRFTDPTWRWNGPPIPDSKPPYSRIFAGDEGRIWVQLYQKAEKKAGAEEVTELTPGEVPEATWIEPVSFDVFEPDGRYLGIVHGPEGFSIWPPPVMRGDTVWAVVRDDMDVPYIVRFHVAHGIRVPT